MFPDCAMFTEGKRKKLCYYPACLGRLKRITSYFYLDRQYNSCALRYNSVTLGQRLVTAYCLHVAAAVV